MTSRSLAGIAIVTLCALLTPQLRLTAQDAQNDPQNEDRPVRYSIVNLGSLAGSYATGNTINNLGWAMGASTYTAQTQDLHATVWAYGQKFDLGTLGGANSAVQWPVKNDQGLIAGVSETAEAQPLKEDWSCADAFFLTVTKHVCVGFAWRWGRMTQLPTLGGANGVAAGVNNRGQIVGWAETPVRDPTCVSPQVLRFEAVIYDRDGRVKELPPLPGDEDGAATAINGPWRSGRHLRYVRHGGGRRHGEACGGLEKWSADPAG